MDLQFFISAAVADANETGDFQQITTLSSARGLDVPLRNVNYAMIQAEGQNVRYRDDAVNPTANIGFLLYTGDPPTKFVGNLKFLRFIEATSGGKINVRYY